MRTLALLLPLTLPLPLPLPLTALAQSTSTADLLQQVDDDRWNLGIAASVRQSPYVGEGTRVQPFPLVSYDGDRVFWQGLSGGIHAFSGDRFGVDVLVAARFDGFDIDDLGHTELRANGLDPGLLDDRDDGLDAGIAVHSSTRAGQIKLRALADVSGTSKGQEVTLDYGYVVQLGRTTLVPGVSVSWMSKDLTRYYYGISDEEVARGVAAYVPGHAVSPQISIGIQRPLGGKWKFTGAASYRFLPDEITDSPLMESDTDGSAGLLLGLSRSF